MERNENGELVGKGVAFRILEFLQEKFNFTTNIHLAEKNIIGSNEDYNGSVVEALNTSVIDSIQYKSPPLLYPPFFVSNTFSFFVCLFQFTHCPQ